MKRSLVVLVAGLAVMLAACLPPKPAPAPPPPPAPAPAPAGSYAFDACAAPSSTTMTTWKQSSPYNGVGVYIGGANRACSQPNLTSSWVSSVTGQGWKLLPIWVGPQAPCTTLSSVTKINADPQLATADGVAQATAAANAANALGMVAWLTPIYYDMEAYPRGGSCTYAVQNFLTGWTQTLNARGFIAAMYSSLCSGIYDAASTVGVPGFISLNAVWIAAWAYDADDARYATYVPNLFGFTGSCPLSDSVWANHERVRQYRGGHDESWGGVVLNVDTNLLDGRVYPPS
jgi:Domain of unknown function (DUF1906)